MLNLNEGEAIQLEGRSCIRPTEQGHTHLVFGPYERLEAGHHVAAFLVAREAGRDVAADELVAILDVAADDGRTILAHGFVFGAQLTGALQPFELAFALDHAADRVEYRVRARADSGIVVCDDASSRSDRGDEVLPVASTPPCSLVRDNPEEIVGLYKRGYQVRRGDGCLLFARGSITFAADERDDLNFAGEVLENRAYNLLMEADQCVIDIGMNVGLTSLSFASRDNVREVHAFEPFPSTYAKAQRNLALNPGLAAKIRSSEVGLSDRSGDEIVLVPDTADSGSRATISVDGGRPVTLKLRDASATLRPIIAAARRAGRRIVMKVDCEGSEFAIFRSLEKGGLLPAIDAFLVEWHAMFPGKTAQTLTAPLLREGFVVVDLSPDQGNGFFYAIRSAAARPSGIRAMIGRLTGRA